MTRPSAPPPLYVNELPRENGLEYLLKKQSTSLYIKSTAKFQRGSIACRRRHGLY